MKTFYTNVSLLGDNILFRGVVNGKRVSKKIPFKPCLYVPSKNKSTGYMGIDGNPLEKMKFESIKESRDFVNSYGKVSNFSIYGSTNYIHQFTSMMFKNEIEFDASLIRVDVIDIETETELGGFPDPKLAREVIQLLTITDAVTRESITFGLADIAPKKKTKYIYCNSEVELLNRFIIHFRNNYPDVVSGWNSNLFDVPYLTNRIKNVLGESHANKLSPWGKINRREYNITETQMAEEYEWVGISNLDYLELYKKFAFKTLENNKLDTVAKEELGRQKVDNPYKTFREFYTKNPELFCDYNIEDCNLVVDIENKMKLIELIITMAYDAKCNYSDIFSPVKTWECILDDAFAKRGKFPKIKNDNPYSYITGAFVQEPVPGKYKWVVSFDATSLYPSIMMTFNMSPDTLIDTELLIPTAGEHSAQYLLDNSDIDLSDIYESDYCMTVNGQLFDKKIKGMIPECIEVLFGKRQIAKKKMLKAEQELEDTQDKSIEKIISSLNNKQQAAKILMNALFGACGNEHFKYLDIRIAEGITTTGQYIIREVGMGIDKYLSEYFNQQKQYVIYSDTDSVYICLSDLVDKECSGMETKEIVDYLDKFCKEKLTPAIDLVTGEIMDHLNAKERKITFKREVIADSAIFMAKKRYAINVHNSEGVAYDPPKVKIKGMEIVRSSTPTVVREKLKAALKILLTSDDNQELIDYVSKFEKEWYNYKPVEIAFPRRVKGIEKYTLSSGEKKKGTPIHVFGVIIYNHYIKKLGITDVYKKIEEGEPIHFIYLKQPNKLRSHVVSFLDEIPEEFGVNKQIDYNEQFQKTFIDPLDKIAKIIQWDIRETSSLDDMFG